MNRVEKYLFDLNGYIVVRNVLSAVEVALANASIDAHLGEVVERPQTVRNTPVGSPLEGNGVSGRKDLGGILQWGEDSHVFRSVLNHHKLRPYFHEILGKGYRMDHLPFAILQEKGSEGFSLHGGTVDCRSGEYCPHLAYSCVNQHMHCHLLGVSVALADQNEGDGGFVVVRGSHKSNFQAPEEMIHGQEYQEFVYQPVIKAGDVLLFSEGTVHGARPWRADHQRRVALYRFSPATCAYGRSYYPTWPQSLLQGMNEEQLAVLLPPYALRLDRSYFPNNDPNSGLEVASRQQEKKDFDKLVFKTDYF